MSHEGGHKAAILIKVVSSSFILFAGTSKELGKFRTRTKKDMFNSLLEERAICFSSYPICSIFSVLWEAGVYSVMFHHKRVADNVMLTFKALTTAFFSQIEATS